MSIAISYDIRRKGPRCQKRKGLSQKELAQMDVTHRAKIFAPFAALAGYENCIAAQQVGYTGRRYLSEEEREKLDRKLTVLHNLTYNGKKARINRPLVTVTWWASCEDPEDSRSMSS